MVRPSCHRHRHREKIVFFCYSVWSRLCSSVEALSMFIPHVCTSLLPPSFFIYLVYDDDDDDDDDGLGQGP